MSKSMTTTDIIKGINYASVTQPYVLKTIKDLLLSQIEEWDGMIGGCRTTDDRGYVYMRCHYDSDTGKCVKCGKELGSIVNKSLSHLIERNRELIKLL